ncbi:MAG: VTT domain-containing protein [Gammaproteobacteria bacterium]
MGGKAKSDDKIQACWREARASRLAVLVDGANVFGTLRKALMKARRSVIIIGWDVDSRTPIVGEEIEPDDGAPVELCELLSHLLDKQPELEIRILLWDYSMLYSLEREPLPRIMLAWKTPPRLKVCLDDQLPIGSSHHQKIVVVDDEIAFVGGLDLTINRWDTPEHMPGDERRKNPDGTIYGPFHDVQMLVEGDVADAIAELARKRWQRASGEHLSRVDVGADPWPEGLDFDMEDVPVAIARTIAAHEDQVNVIEVKATYLEMITAAEHAIYIENQYLTTEVVAQALHGRMQESPDLEVVVICPESPGGWLEAKTMGVGLDRFMRHFEDESVEPRIRFLAPSVQGGGQTEPLMVHAKVMIVDDQYLRVGSSNLNNRSMAVDTECDLIVLAETDAHRAAIREIRGRLLSEHLGISAEELSNRIDDTGSLIGAVENGPCGTRLIKRLTPAEEDPDSLTETLKSLADPEESLDPGDVLGDAFAAVRQSSVRQRLLRLSLAGAALVGLILLWHITPLAELTDPETLAARIGAWRGEPWAVPVLLLVFVVGSLIAFPVSALIILTAMLLGPWQGFLCALFGSMAGASASYGLGAILGRRVVDDLLGKFRHSVDRSLQNNGIAAAALLRVVPVAPFTVVNVLLGSSSLRFGDYMIGTLIGMGPGIAVISFLGDRLREAWRHPDPGNVAMLVLAVLVWVAFAIGLQIAARQIRNED